MRQMRRRRENEARAGTVASIEARYDVMMLLVGLQAAVAEPQTVWVPSLRLGWTRRLRITAWGRGDACDACDAFADNRR